MHRAVFLDRDDTLNVNADLPAAAWKGRPGDLLNPDFVQLLPGVLEACRDLRNANFMLVVITNQSGVAHGSGSLRDLDATNDRIDQLLTDNDRPLIAAFYAAPTHPDGSESRFAGEHPWRKPGPGMIHAAARELEIDLQRSWMVGDKARDVDAGVAAGIPPTQSLRIGPGQRFEDLAAAARYLLDHSGTPIGPTSAISLRADDPNLLQQVADTVLATARSIAERAGLRLVDLDIHEGSLHATITGHRLAALGFATELRRLTNHWARTHHARPIWPDAPHHD